MQIGTMLPARAGKRARQLGSQMLRDPAIRPHLHQTHQYEDYAHFRLAHRALWEQSSAFEPYQEKLYAIADRELSDANPSGGNSVANWDYWYSRIMGPIKDAMWEVWEDGVKLEELYVEACWKGGKWNGEAAPRKRPATQPSTPRNKLVHSVRQLLTWF